MPVCKEQVTNLQSPAAEFVSQLRPSRLAHENFHDGLVVGIVAQHNLVHHGFNSAFIRFVLLHIPGKHYQMTDPLKLRRYSQTLRHTPRNACRINIYVFWHFFAEQHIARLHFSRHGA